MKDDSELINFKPAWEVRPMMSRILWINPIGIDADNQSIQEFLNSVKHPETEVKVVSLGRGPHHLRYHYYESLVLSDTLTMIRTAESESYNAAIIGCFYDPGLHAAREIAKNLIVTAPAESSMHIASSLGDTFSIIVNGNKNIPKMRENVINYGFERKLSSFRSVGIKTLDFQKDPEEAAKRIKETAKKAVEQDLAEVVILGCTLQFGFFRAIQDDIGVPVIDPVLAPFKYAEFLVELRGKAGWGHSKVGRYEPPPEAELSSWELGRQYSHRSS